MIYVFLIYGLAFVLFGLGVSIYPAAETASPIARNKWLLAAFGISHGVNEWVDMLLLANAPGADTLQLLRPALLAGSFLCLLAFGASVRPHRAVRVVPGVGLILWLTAEAVYGWGAPPSSAFTRYFLAAPAAGLAAWAFCSDESLLGVEIPRGKRHVRLIGTTFVAYGLFAGLVVAPADFFPASTLNTRTFLEVVGVPVQAFRSACAVVLAHQTLRILDGIRKQKERLLAENREQLEQRVATRTAELQATLDKVRVLTGLLPICAWCKKIRDDGGYWADVEVFVADHSDADFSHGICPDCEGKLRETSRARLG